MNLKEVKSCFSTIIFKSFFFFFFFGKSIILKSFFPNILFSLGKVLPELDLYLISTWSPIVGAKPTTMAVKSSLLPTLRNFPVYPFLLTVLLVLEYFVGHLLFTVSFVCSHSLTHRYSCAARFQFLLSQNLNNLRRFRETIHARAPARVVCD